MAKISISIPDDLNRQLDEACEKTRRSRSDLVQEALARYFGNQENPPPPDRTDEMLELLRSVAADAARVRRAVDCFWPLPPSDPQEECRDFEELVEEIQTFPTPGDYYFPRRARPGCPPGHQDPPSE
ncbi:MAG: CopG family transcriptional regulator [Armatimonadetes bacterium]|nr:CopG family transcriptional regulator [Armatimonadota bacterium]